MSSQSPGAAPGPRIGVMGAGAVGGYVGGMLAAHGADVLLVGRPSVKDAFASGLVLTDVGGSRVEVPRERLAFAVDDGALADRDVVLVCVKSGQTAEVAQRLEAILQPGAVVVSFQNGVRNPELLRAGLPGRTVLGGIVGFNVVWRGTNGLHRAIGGPLVIEAPGDATGTELCRLLAASGFDVQTPGEIAPLQWTKLVMNLNNAVSALSGVPTRELLLGAGYRRILAALVEEALVVLRRAGIRTARVGSPIPVALLPRLLRLPTPLFRILAFAALDIDPEARASMWEDLQRGRRTEVEELNGEIVKMASTQGLDAPLNRRILALVHEAEERSAGSPCLGAAELSESLSADVRRPA